MINGISSTEAKMITNMMTGHWMKWSKETSASLCEDEDEDEDAPTPAATSSLHVIASFCAGVFACVRFGLGSHFNAEYVFTVLGGMYFLVLVAAQQQEAQQQQRWQYEERGSGQQEHKRHTSKTREEENEEEQFSYPCDHCGHWYHNCAEVEEGASFPCIIACMPVKQELIGWEIKGRTCIISTYHGFASVDLVGEIIDWANDEPEGDDLIWVRWTDENAEDADFKEWRSLSELRDEFCYDICNPNKTKKPVSAKKKAPRSSSRSSSRLRQKKKSK